MILLNKQIADYTSDGRPMREAIEDWLTDQEYDLPDISDDQATKDALSRFETVALSSGSTSFQMVEVLWGLEQRVAKLEKQLFNMKVWGGVYGALCGDLGMKYCSSMHTPWDDPDPPCDLCGNDVDNCVCHVCPECESQGDLECYVKHGLKATMEQVRCMRENQALWEEEARAVWLAEKEMELDPYSEW